jgi:hypothetical protein
MNIYNFIYCSFYNLWEKRGSDGRLSATGVIFFTLLIHISLIFEIILDTTGYELSLFPNNPNSTYGDRKTLDFIISIPFLIAIWFFYNRKRTSRLLEEYDEEYGEDERRITLRVFLFVILPVIIAITLSTLRHKGYF